MLMRLRDRRSGFTLLELMVVTIIVSIVMLSVTQSFIFQAKIHEVVTGISESQQSIAMVMQLIERDLRNAGYMVSDNVAICGVDATNGPDTLFISDSDAISLVSDLGALQPGSNTYISSAGPEGDGLGIRLTNASAFTTTGSTTLKLASASLDTVASYENETSSGTVQSDFQYAEYGSVTIQGGVIIRDVNDSSEGVACGVITNVVSSTEFQVSWMSPAITFSTPGDVIVVPAHVYRADASNPPRLLRNGLALASDVEDFQVSYFFDLDDDGLVDSTESRGSAGETIYTANEAAIAASFDRLRGVTVSVAVRTAFETAEDSFSLGRPQDVENHIIASPAEDGYRRRILTSTIYPRNVGTELGG